MRRTARFSVVLLASSSFLLAGCAQTPGGGYLSSNVADPNDVCGVAHAELLNSKGFFERAILEGALAGAVVGALSGALIAGLSGRSAAQGAAIGAGAGVLAGAAGGYWQAKQQQTQDVAALSTSINSDLDKEAAEVARASAAFEKVSVCRTQAAATIKADLKAGIITRDVATTRMAEQKTRFKEEIAAAEAIGAKMIERQKEFATASDQLLEKDTAAKTSWANYEAARAAPPPPPPPPAPAKKAPAKAKAAPQAAAPTAAPAVAAPPATTGSKVADVKLQQDNTQKRTVGYNQTVASTKAAVDGPAFEIN
ncbi:exported hypothetical protein [Candidatus Terasakiella magnetica]|nr:exported hypothetical protein [Candidatus Terasakiella magnetica]